MLFSESVPYWKIIDYFSVRKSQKVSLSKDSIIYPLLEYQENFRKEKTDDILIPLPGLVSFLHILFILYPYMCIFCSVSHMETEIHFHFILHVVLLPSSLTDFLLML